MWILLLTLDRFVLFCTLFERCGILFLMGVLFVMLVVLLSRGDVNGLRNFLVGLRLRVVRFRLPTVVLSVLVFVLFRLRLFVIPFGGYFRRLCDIFVCLATSAG